MGHKRGKDNSINHPNSPPSSMGESHGQERCKMLLKRHVKTGTKTNPREAQKQVLNVHLAKKLGNTRHRRRELKLSPLLWGQPLARQVLACQGDGQWLCQHQQPITAAGSAPRYPQSTPKPGEGRGSPVVGVPQTLSCVRLVRRSCTADLPKITQPAARSERDVRLVVLAGAKHSVFSLFLPQGMGTIATPCHIPITHSSRCGY